MAAVRSHVATLRVADAAVSTAEPAVALCLVHLVWPPLGPERLAAFVDAYRRFDWGVPHELLVVEALRPGQASRPDVRRAPGVAASHPAHADQVLGGAGMRGSGAALASSTIAKPFPTLSSGSRLSSTLRPAA